MEDKMLLRLENRDMLHTRVVSVLRNAIVRGDFKPRERLVQSTLAEQLGVSRMPIREALRKLESEGLVSIEPHRGAIVNSISIEDIEEVYGLRSQLEQQAALLSVTKLTNEDLDLLQQIYEKMEQTNVVEEFVIANIEFHRLIISRCSWKRLHNFIDTLWTGFPQQTPHILPNQMKESNVEHKAILDAAKKRDHELTAMLLGDHIQRTGESLVAQLKEQ
jgi:DNA-binding GntR family transcriptional regulator